jgi:hypothetical protein
MNSSLEFGSNTARVGAMTGGVGSENEAPYVFRR